MKTYRGDIFFDFSEPDMIVNMLGNPNYYRNKGLECEIVHMSPETFLKESAKVHGTSVIVEMRLIDNEKVKRYAEAFAQGKRAGLPWLNYVTREQDGRNRVRAVYFMIERRWIENTLVPVAVIRKA